MKLNNDRREYLHDKFAKKVLRVNLTHMTDDFNREISAIQTELDKVYAKADAIVNDPFTKRILDLPSVYPSQDVQLLNFNSFGAYSQFTGTSWLGIDAPQVNSVECRYIANTYYHTTEKIKKLIGDDMLTEFQRLQKQANETIEKKKVELENVIALIDGCTTLAQVKERLPSIESLVPQSWYEEEKHRKEADRLRREQRKREAEILKVKRELEINEKLNLSDLDRAVAVAKITGDL